MTNEEIVNRREVLMCVAIELNHNPALAGEYHKAEHWIKREIARYDRKLAGAGSPPRRNEAFVSLARHGV